MTDRRDIVSTASIVGTAVTCAVLAFVAVIVFGGL